ncbi:Imm49 family immunity protein [Streptomyces sp. MB09-01]|uniref:immunity 49 family protein n=1 Tax=Streptomyces sp. MB09-01 TaxID=3028666 RepID=UPI0029BE72CA|nr:Imm49 family immunity protein [Streptomyces sp. MB09-01]MDX3539001.1 Imm49 family immunity protein [Streptomyces sp. MB09-01]
MRIERHQVGEAVVSAAREDFANRIGGQVRSMSKAGRMATYEWQSVADEFLDYLGALSVETRGLDTPEAEAVLKDAAEAAAGAVCFAAYYPHCTFQVFLDYVNFGISYDPGDEAGAGESVSPGEWIDAFCLALLRDKAKWHGEAFHFARQKFAEEAQGSPAGELITGFTAQFLDDTGNDAEYPPSAQAKLAAIDAALARVRSRAEETGESLLDRPDSTALRTLRALAVEDREAFDSGLAALLLAHATSHGPAASPASLLPLMPLALASVAYRTLGWMPAVHSDYLPHALVTGFEARGPRVGGLGRDRRPDAVAALAAGPLVVQRPGGGQPVNPRIEALWDQSVQEALTSEEGKPLAASRLGSAMHYQELLFKWRAGNSADVTDAQLANLRLASQLGAAVFRIALAEPGTEAEVTIDGQNLRYPAARGEAAGADNWTSAVAFALITGVREDLAPVVLAGPAIAGKDGSAFASYREALHAYLTGVDAEPAAQRALRGAEKAKEWGFFPPPAVLLSQLVEGDEESFNLALADALEAHRDHYQVADRADTLDVAIDLNVLALACHARRRGWDIRVESPYLPQRLLKAAQPV